jgi:hypothetical protein
VSRPLDNIPRDTNAERARGGCEGAPEGAKRFHHLRFERDIAIEVSKVMKILKIQHGAIVSRARPVGAEDDVSADAIGRFHDCPGDMAKPVGLGHVHRRYTLR